MDKRLWVIVKKELLRVFTDRRLIFTVLLLPGLSIAIMYSIMGIAIGNMEGERAIHEYLIDIYNAPVEFVEYVDNSTEYRINIEQILDTSYLQESKQSLIDEEIDLVMVFDKQFDYSINNYKNNEIPNVNTYFNPINDYSQDAYSYITNLVLPDYKTKILSQRLGNIEYTYAFSIDMDNIENSVASESKITGKVISGILPILISVFLFAGAMGIGIDMVAGEKERGTMSSILLTPVKRETVALGKIISLGVVAIVAAFSSMMGIVLSFPFSSRIFGGGMSLNSMTMSPMQSVYLVITLLLLVGIYVGIIILISIISKTVKEAASYLGPIYMIVFISGFMAMMSNSEATLIRYLIPIYGNIIILQDIFSAEINLSYFFVNSMMSIALIIILVTVVKKVFYYEKFMF